LELPRPRENFFNLAREKERLLALGYEPEPKLLAERLDVKKDEIIEMGQRLGSWEVSIDSPVREDSNQDYGSFCRQRKWRLTNRFLLRSEGNCFVKN